MRIDPALPFLLLALSGACSSAAGSAPRTHAAAIAGPRLSQAEYEARIAAGRAQLAAGQAAEAEALFASAAAADGDSLRTRMWVLRAWMDQRRSNDTLDALDALDRAGENGTEMLYLYGMAFARRAEGYLADGVSDASVHMNFVDAANFLEQAVRAEPERYRDAYLPLAGAAWYVEKLDTARFAVDHAVEVEPASGPAWLLRGRIVLAQFAEAEADQPGSPEVEALWSEAADSFTRAVAAFGTPSDEPTQARLAEAATQLGHTLVWKQKGPEATEAYATALAWNPAAFPYAKAFNLLRPLKVEPDDERPNGFRAALELGHTRLEERLGPDDARAGTLLWWLGWARFVAADWKGAEEAFQGALAHGPQFSNGWFYLGLARQYRKDSEGALAAMHSGWDADPVSMVSVAASAGGALRAFESLLGWCASQEPPRNLDAAFLAGMLAEALPSEPRHWNNLGLFLRDEGERLELVAHREHTSKPEQALLDDLYGRSFAAYERALALSPDDPQLLNDTALMLIYHVGPDYPRAELMFRRALELFDQKLAAAELSAEDRQQLETSRSDAAENLQRILDHLSGKDAAPADGTDEGTDEGGAEESDEAGTAEAAASGGG